MEEASTNFSLVDCQNRITENLFNYIYNDVTNNKLLIEIIKKYIPDKGDSELLSIVLRELETNRETIIDLIKENLLVVFDFFALTNDEHAVKCLNFTPLINQYLYNVIKLVGMSIIENKPSDELVCKANLQQINPESLIKLVDLIFHSIKSLKDSSDVNNVDVMLGYLNILKVEISEAQVQNQDAFVDIFYNALLDFPSNINCILFSEVFKDVVEIYQNLEPKEAYSFY
jgi:hypothetical protein